MGLRCVPELYDQRMPLERLLHNPSLDADAATVNQPDFPEPRLVSGGHIFSNHRLHVARREGVKVEGVFEGDLHGVDAIWRRRTWP